LLAASLVLALPGCSLGPDLCELSPDRCGVEPGSSTSATPCGNGVIDEGEECDDKNNADGDGCNHDCRVACQAIGVWTKEREVSGHHCYFKEESAGVTWDGARAACQVYPGADLAGVSDNEEWYFFSEVNLPLGNDIWVGGHDPMGDVSYVWVNGEPYTDLALDTPLEAGQCMYMVGSEDKFTFASAPCTDTKPAWLCERPAPGSPPPM
jgi:cysteine-rich repeat protein